MVNDNKIMDESAKEVAKAIDDKNLEGISGGDLNPDSLLTEERRMQKIREFDREWRSMANPNRKR